MPHQPCRTVPTDTTKTYFFLQHKGFRVGLRGEGPDTHGAFVPASCPPANSHEVHGSTHPCRVNRGTRPSRRVLGPSATYAIPSRGQSCPRLTPATSRYRSHAHYDSLQAQRFLPDRRAFRHRATHPTPPTSLLRTAERLFPWRSAAPTPRNFARSAHVTTASLGRRPGRPDR